MFVAFVYQVGGMPCEYPAPLAAIDARRVEPSMYAWLDVLALAGGDDYSDLFVISILSILLRGEMRMIKCIAKLYREFVDDYTSNLPGPRS
jgi:hypothetical protein